MSALGAFLRDARSDARLSRRAACEAPGLVALGVTRRRLEAIERGEHLPDLVEWAELAQLYMLDAEDVARGLSLAWRGRAEPAVSVRTGSEPAAAVLLMVPSPGFGAWLRRAARHTSVVDLARQLAPIRGATAAQVAAWFHGRAAPDAAQWPVLCDALGIDPEERAAGLQALRQDRSPRPLPASDTA